MDFVKWSNDAIAKNGLNAYMQDFRVEWIALLSSRLKFLLEGRTFIVITDEDRSWFESYLLKRINRSGARPLLPFVALKSIYPHLDEISSPEEILLLEDMLSIMFPNGYVYFYIGKHMDKRANIAKNNDDSYMWLFDEQSHNSICLNSKDENLDIRLIELLKLFDKSIDAVLLNQVSLL